MTLANAIDKHRKLLKVTVDLRNLRARELIQNALSRNRDAPPVSALNGIATIVFSGDDRTDMKPLRLIRSEMSYFHTFIAAGLPRRRGRTRSRPECFLLQGPVLTPMIRVSVLLPQLMHLHTSISMTKRDVQYH